MRRAGWLLAGALAAGAGAYGLRCLLARAGAERQGDEFRRHWRRAGATIPEEAIHLVALGDGTAQGVGASRVDHGYVPLLAVRLGEAVGRQVVVTNLSAPGASVRDVVREQLPLLAELARPADILTVGIGGNDVLQAHGNAISFEKHLADVLAALPAGSFVSDVPWFATPPRTGRAVELAEIARCLIERHGHHLVGLHEAMRAKGPLHLYTRLAVDLVHPNDAGYREWADAFWDAIEASGRLERLGFRDGGGLG